MRNILISIKPQYVCKILNKEKILEIRKSMPKCELPCKVYIYCTKDNSYKLLQDNETGQYFKGITSGNDANHPSDTEYGMNCEYETQCCTRLNGKVVAEFTLNKIDKIEICDPYIFRNNEQEDWKYFEKNACLTCEQMMEYIGYGEDHDGWDKKYDIGYAWRIDNLIIYDKPKELKSFSKFGYEPLGYSSICGNRDCPFFADSNCYDLPPDCLLDKDCILTRPPQSYMFVEGE